MSLFRGLRPLQRASAFRDALAGVVLGAMDIPQVLGYSKIAGMPVVTGLYSLLPLVAFAAFGSSRYRVVAADSATSAIFAGGVSGMATPRVPAVSEQPAQGPNLPSEHREAVALCRPAAFANEHCSAAHRWAKQQCENPGHGRHATSSAKAGSGRLACFELFNA